MHFLPKTLLCLGGLGVLYAMTPAFAQSSGDVQVRLNYLENEVQTLGRAVYKGESSAASLQGSADLQTQIQDFEVQLRQLNGQIEEVSHSVRLLREDVEKANNDNAMRLSDLETRVSNLETRAASSMSASASSAGQGQNPGAPSSSVTSLLGQMGAAAGSDAATGSAAETTQVADAKSFQAPGMSSDAAALAEYETAFSLLKQGQYNSAQVHFEDFIKHNPQHALASNAKYWLGETYYVRGDYNAAARVFAEGFQAYPRGAKAPDNLLKLGLSLDSLGKKKESCIALGQVRKEFPAGASAVLTRAEKEMERIQCP